MWRQGSLYGFKFRHRHWCGLVTKGALYTRIRAPDGDLAAHLERPGERFEALEDAAHRVRGDRVTRADPRGPEMAAVELKPVHVRVIHQPRQRLADLGLAHPSREDLGLPAREDELRVQGEIAGVHVLHEPQRLGDPAPHPLLPHRELDRRTT